MKFKAESLDWARQHIIRYGDTDIFPQPFEFQAINSCWKTQGGVREWILRQKPDSWKSRNLRRCLVPKHRFGFRPSTQLDPIDTIVFTALVHDIGSDIEKKRIPTSSATVHSYRFKPKSNGQMYDPAWGWVSFLKRSRSLAKPGEYEFVVLADIADFFPKLYSHPLRNEIVACTRKKTTAEAVWALVKQWNQTRSYGIPVGPAASRLLSELALTLIDDALTSRSLTFCRYSDDYRIFCRDFRGAHESLAYLAHLLFENLGLTLQQQKTTIMPVGEFQKLLLSPRRQERSRLSEQFELLVQALGLQDPYEAIDYSKLSPLKKQLVRALNLGEILEEQIDLHDALDIPVTSFVLRRLAQLRDTSHLDLVVDNLDVLYPVFQDAIRYISVAERLHGNKRRTIGAKLIRALDDSISGHLEFHRACVLNVFAETKAWDNESVLATLESKWTDSFTARELILARGRAGHTTYFKSQRYDVNNLGPWERRAFLYAASCLPGDEAKHWWDGLKAAGDTDPVDRAIFAYGKNNPITKD